MQVTLAPADAAIGEAVGIPVDRPAGITVEVRAVQSSVEPPRIAPTDAAGRVTFDRLLEGRYSIGVSRDLTPAERAALPVDDTDVSGFAGATAISVTADTAQRVTVQAVAARPGSLIISEIWPYAPDFYYDSGYLEVHNNADSTVFLDGALFGLVPPVHTNIGAVPPALDRCALWETSIRTNATDLAVYALWEFPGAGRDFPLRPGESAVIATDAIDHRPFAADALDLSTADFEFIGDTRDVDNPSVPNLIRRRGGIGTFGRGPNVSTQLAVGVKVLARPVRATLRTETVDSISTWSADLPFIPRADVLDVVALEVTAEGRAELAALGLPVTDCDPWLSAVWDREPARIANPNRHITNAAGYTRRVAFTAPDGRVVLQRTRTSARDWLYGAPPTPGFVRP